MDEKLDEKLNGVICTYSYCVCVYIYIYNEVGIIEKNTSTMIFSRHHNHIELEGRRACVSKLGGKYLDNRLLNINIAICC